MFNNHPPQIIGAPPTQQAKTVARAAQMQGVARMIGTPRLNPETDLFWTNDDGKLHRESGEPAIIYDNGTKAWYENGFLHRLDGPAIELNMVMVASSNDTKKYYIKGKRYEFEEWKEEIKKYLTVNEVSRVLLNLA